MGIKQFIDQKFYPNYASNWDNYMFKNKILEYLKPQHILLDIGAGAGIIDDFNFKNKAAKVIGVDPDIRVKQNQFLHEAFVGYGNDMPFIKDSSVDIIICNNVLEHIENPNSFFKEVHRVLKPNGLFFTKTPNKYYYVSLIAKCTPLFFHKFINKMRGRQSEDTFNTYYKINTKNSQKNLALKFNFKIEEQQSIEGRPEYLRHFNILYILGLIYERFLNILHLDLFKSIIITVFKKK